MRWGAPGEVQEGRTPAPEHAPTLRPKIGHGQRIALGTGRLQGHSPPCKLNRWCDHEEPRLAGNFAGRAERGWRCLRRNTRARPANSGECKGRRTYGSGGHTAPALTAGSIPCLGLAGRFRRLTLLSGDNSFAVYIRILLRNDVSDHLLRAATNTDRSAKF